LRIANGCGGRGGNTIFCIGKYPFPGYAGFGYRRLSSS